MNLCAVCELWSTIRTRNFGSVAMCRAVLFILRSRLLLYSAGSEVNRVQVVLPGFSVRLFCSRKPLDVRMVVCIYFMAALVLVWVDVICIDHDLKHCLCNASFELTL